MNVAKTKWEIKSPEEESVVLNFLQAKGCSFARGVTPVNTFPKYWYVYHNLLIAEGYERAFFESDPYKNGFSESYAGKLTPIESEHGCASPKYNLPMILPVGSRLQANINGEWVDVEEYRVVPKKPVYEYKWGLESDAIEGIPGADTEYCAESIYMTDKEAEKVLTKGVWVRLNYTKRERNGNESL